MKCKYKESCGHDICREEDCENFEAAQRTNGDWIRSMSDKEFAKRMLETYYPDEIHFCKEKLECAEALDRGGEIPEGSCIECMLEWLKRPYKGDDTNG